MPSGEVRRFRMDCMASIRYSDGNEQHQNVDWLPLVVTDVLVGDLVYVVLL